MWSCQHKRHFSTKLCWKHHADKKSWGDYQAALRRGLFQGKEDAACTCRMPFRKYRWLPRVLSCSPHTPLAFVMPGICLIVYHDLKLLGRFGWLFQTAGVSYKWLGGSKTQEHNNTWIMFEVHLFLFSVWDRNAPGKVCPWNDEYLKSRSPKEGRGPRALGSKTGNRNPNVNICLWSPGWVKPWTKLYFPQMEEKKKKPGICW